MKTLRGAKSTSGLGVQFQRPRNDSEDPFGLLDVSPNHETSNKDKLLKKITF